MQGIFNKEGYGQGLQFLHWKRNVPSLALAVVCAACVSLVRGFSISNFVLADIPFSYTDAFMIVAAGIGGLGCGLLSFSLLFMGEFCRLSGDFIGLYALVTYLVLVLVAALLAYRGWFARPHKILASVAIITAILALCWYFTFTVLISDYNININNIFLNISLFKLLLGALPECALGVAVTAAFFRYAPAAVKLRFGSGWLYTGSRTDESRHRYVLARRIILLSLGEALILTVVSIVFSDIQFANESDWRLTLACFFEMWRQNLQMGFMTACVAVPIAYLFNLFIMNNVVHPINAMSLFMERYFSNADNMGGRLETLPDLGIRSGDEIEQLYKSLRKMVQDMAGYLDTQEQKAALEMEVKSARAANKAKSDFLSNMSHEIRTPINAVLGLDEMILRECGDTAIRSYAADIRSSGKMLLAIINDILDFSKIEAGKMEIVPADYDVSVIIADLVNMVANRAEAKGLNFIVQVDEAMPHKLRGDDTRIKQCILNILTNAVKYTREGSVTLSVGFIKKDEAHILLSARVEDTGIGIREEDLKKLFSPFERIEESRNRAIEGTGLGMSIVKSLLAAMGTQLVVKSDYGKGSDFSFSVEQEVTDWEPIGNYEEAKRKASEGAEAYTESFQAPGARILVVDDTPMNLTVMKGLLKPTRLRIDTAQDAITALTMAQETPYHLIFIDHLMPRMDGIEMLRELRGDGTSANQHTPCVALTANALGGAREMYLAAGFTDYLSKPVDSAKLEALLARRLPADLVLREGDEGFAAVQKDGTWNGVERRAHGTAGADPILFALFALDSAAALKNCGSAEVFADAVRDFHDAIEEKAARIAEYAAGGGWKDYTILIHALKSSARLIGAGGLSELAKELEAAGERAQGGDEGAMDDIRKRTPQLLADYRAYSEKLAPLCGKAGRSPAASTRPVIAPEKLAEAFAALREVASAFDFDTADAIIAELDGYALGEEDAARFAAVRQAVRGADRAKVLALLEGSA